MKMGGVDTPFVLAEMVKHIASRNGGNHNLIQDTMDSLLRAVDSNKAVSFSLGPIIDPTLFPV